MLSRKSIRKVGIYEGFLHACCLFCGVRFCVADLLMQLRCRNSA